MRSQGRDVACPERPCRCEESGIAGGVDEARLTLEERGSERRVRSRFSSLGGDSDSAAKISASPISSVVSVPPAATVIDARTVERGAVGSIGCATMFGAESHGDEVLAIAKSKSEEMLNEPLIVLDDQDGMRIVKPIDLAR